MLQRTTQILLDAARIGGLMSEAKERNKAHESLYRGTSSETLAPVAPYLFPFGWNSPFASWMMHTGWGNSWGVLLKSAWPLQELHKHFRKFLKVQTESGQSLYFRFYDPRVLRIFLPTCDPAQIREFFGGAIDYFIVEDEDPAYALRFTHQNGVLQTERFSVRDEIAALPEPEPLPPAAEDPLPPEAIEALREQGISVPDGATPSMLQAILDAHGVDGPAEPAPVAQTQPAQRSIPVPTAAPAPPAAVQTAPAPEAAPAVATPKPKTKWNTFD